ncbi:hypothetical protein L873DRAFT_1836180 [Choiromyces venosus 120613-1]|uniref:Uncharacterized protein n=1 Tax=Choiromyces venosus 120613-1 TaxID=1336337 RepID=A0A3N4JI84_9PEZI|nr:hypothetical protein L873DRAFT_1836180 [Choiromyces venosus 120613-1]
MIHSKPKLFITTVATTHSLYNLLEPKVMLKLIPPPLRTTRLHHMFPKRAFHTTSICRTLSPADKLWIAPSDADPSTRDYTLAFRTARLPKPAAAAMLPQICRGIINSNPDISISSAVRKVVERAGYAWETCWSCEKIMLSPGKQDSRKAEDIPALLVLPFPMAPAGPSAAALPKELIKSTCHDLSDLSYQFSPVLSALPMIEKGMYISTLWKRLLPLFKGTLRASVHKILPDEEREAHVETLVHRFEASGSITVVFIHAELTDENSLALVSGEVEECDYINATNGLWSPVLAILSNGLSFQYFIYNSITAPTRISASRVFSGLKLVSGEEGFEEDGVEKVLQRMYYVFLCGHINGIKAQIRRISMAYGEEDGAGRALERALEEAELALEIGKGAIDSVVDVQGGVEALASRSTLLTFLPPSAEYLRQVTAKPEAVNHQ